MTRDWTVHVEAIRAGDRRRDEKRASEEMLARVRVHWRRAEIRLAVERDHDAAIIMDDAIFPRRVLRFADR